MKSVAIGQFGVGKVYCAISIPNTDARPETANRRNDSSNNGRGPKDPLYMAYNQESAPAVMPKHWIAKLVPSADPALTPSAVKAGMNTIPPPAPVEFATMAPQKPKNKK